MGTEGTVPESIAFPVSTGLIGTFLLVWGLGRPLIWVLGLIREPGLHRVLLFLTLIGLWFLTVRRAQLAQSSENEDAIG